MVMVSNQTNFKFGHLAGKYPGALGHLYSPGGHTGPYSFMPYALDNGAYLSQVVEALTAPDVNASARWALSTQAHKTWSVR